MPWARLEDSYFTHRKVADLSKDAKLLDLAAIAFSARELRDGELTKADVRIIAAQVDVADAFAVAQELIDAGRWGASDSGYVIHDYLKYNPSREDVLKEREASAKRVAEWRAKKKASRKPAKTSNGVTNSARTASPDPVPEPGPAIETRSPDPVPKSKPDDTRATRESSEFEPEGVRSRRNGSTRVSTVLVPPGANGSVRFERVAFNEDLAVRIQAIGGELDDDNIAASITRAQRYQAAAHLDDGAMANAVKDALRRIQKRLDDFSRPPPGSRMAYFLATLEQTTQERART